MSDLSIHPIEYFKVHFHMDFGVICKRLPALLVTFANKVIDLAERVVAVAVVFLTLGLIIFAFMQVSKDAFVTAGFSSAITEMVVPSLLSLPMGL